MWGVDKERWEKSATGVEIPEPVKLPCIGRIIYDPGADSANAASSSGSNEPININKINCESGID
jgi:hypothetical protein